MMGLATKEEQKERTAICHACDKFKDDRCTVCKCYIPMKVSFSACDCPLDKWKKET